MFTRIRISDFSLKRARDGPLYPSYMINHWEWPSSGGVAENSPESDPCHPSLQLSVHPDYHGASPVFPAYGQPVAEILSAGSHQHQYYYHQQEQDGPPMVVGGGWDEGRMVGFNPARIGLDLGGRTYFSEEDGRIAFVAGGSPTSVPRCQAEGCRADLQAAKHYHRRHKVCELHSKAATVVIAGGATQRFCQQCSRFHELSEFDEGKRSCRKRLADHNRRRRKSQAASSSSQHDQSLSINTSTMAAQSPFHNTNINATRQNFVGKARMAESDIPWLSSTPSSSGFQLKRRVDEEDEAMDSGGDVENALLCSNFLTSALCVALASRLLC